VSRCGICRYAASANCSAISLFTRSTVPLPDTDHRRHLQYAPPGTQMAPDGVLDLGRHQLLPLLADAIQAGALECTQQARQR
jgi:hypothetical protein